MFLWGISYQMLLSQNGKLLLSPPNSEHLFSVVNTQLASVLWFAAFPLLEHIKTWEKKVPEWI